MDKICVGIKHVSSFPHRKLKLKLLIESLSRYNLSNDIIIADDGNNPSNYDNSRLIMTNGNPGLSAGRNALVAACKRPYIAILDDDLVVTNQSKFSEMIDFMERHGEYDLVAGCYEEHSSLLPTISCYTHNISIRRLILSTYPVKHHPREITNVEIAHNFFVARTAVLLRYKWDDRMRMIEHEPFYIQLKLANRRVACMSDSIILHNRSSYAIDGYHMLSARYKESRFLQYTCYDYPQFSRFHLPYTRLNCKGFTYCQPSMWNHDNMNKVPWKCRRFEHNENDHSIVASSYAGRTLDLFVGIVSHFHDAHRKRMRRTLLQRMYNHMEDDPWSPLLQWDYAFFVGVDGPRISTGDIVYLACRDGYHFLGEKVVKMIQWWDANIKSKHFLKVDTDTWFHPGRIRNWLVLHGSDETFYGGDVSYNAEVVRPGMRKTDFIHPEWLPDDFLKWQVPRALYHRQRYPPYAKGGAYILGADVVRTLARYFHPQNRPLIFNNLEDITVALAIYKTIPTMKVVPIPGFTELAGHDVAIFKAKDKESYCEYFDPNIMAYHRLPFHLWC